MSCKRCGSTERTSDGKRCKPCTYANNARWEKRNSESRNAWMRERMQRRKDLLIAWLGHVCEDCGGSFHRAAMDFHHVDPSTKSMSIAGANLSKKMRTLLDEASKCALLCSNCHRTRHATNNLGELPAPTR